MDGKASTFNYLFLYGDFCKNNPSYGVAEAFTVCPIVGWDGMVEILSERYNRWMGRGESCRPTGNWTGAHVRPTFSHQAIPYPQRTAEGGNPKAKSATLGSANRFSFEGIL